MSMLIANKKGITLCGFLTAFVLMLQTVFVPMGEVSAKTSKIEAMNKIKADYQAFALKVKTDYKNYELFAKTEYQNLKTLAATDYQQLKLVASTDYQKVKQQYGYEKTEAYYDEIYSSNLSMDNYYSNIYSSNLAMDSYYSQIYSSNRAMDYYYSQVYGSNGALDLYYSQVYGSNGLLDQFYSNGGSVETLYKNFDKVKAETLASLNKTRLQTMTTITNQKNTTIRVLQQAKLNAKTAMSNIRKSITGTTINYGVFGIDHLKLPVPPAVKKPVTPAPAKPVVPVVKKK